MIIIKQLIKRHFCSTNFNFKLQNTYEDDSGSDIDIIDFPLDYLRVA